MTTVGIPTSPYLPGTQLQYAWDSTCLTTFMECPRKYQLRILLGWVTRSPKRQIALDFGILLHRGVELYHRIKAGNGSLDHDACVEQTTAAIMADPLFLHLPTEEAVEELKAEADESGDDAEHKQSKVRTRYHLLRALVWYFEHWRNDPMQTYMLKDGTPAVELSFRVPTGLRIAGEDVIYCGHIDRVARYMGSIFPTDLKTTSHSLGAHYFSLFDISHQMTGYTFAGHIILPVKPAGAVIDGISLLVGGVKFGRHPTYRSRSQLSEFVQQLGHYTEQAEQFHEEGHYPLNTTSCRFCEFAGICSKPPEVRQMYLAQRFRQEPSWNPLQNR